MSGFRRTQSVIQVTTAQARLYSNSAAPSLGSGRSAHHTVGVSSALGGSSRSAEEGNQG
jgi:hypothetical protein